MNDEIYNISYDALLTIMELCDVLLEEEHEIENAYAIIKAIRKISIQSKSIIFEKNERANN